MYGGKKERYVYDQFNIDVEPDLKDLKDYCNHVAELGWRVVQVIDTRPVSSKVIILVERLEKVKV